MRGYDWSCGTHRNDFWEYTRAQWSLVGRIQRVGETSFLEFPSQEHRAWASLICHHSRLWLSGHLSTLVSSLWLPVRWRPKLSLACVCLSLLLARLTSILVLKYAVFSCGSECKSGTSSSTQKRKKFDLFTLEYTLSTLTLER